MDETMITKQQALAAATYGTILHYTGLRPCRLVVGPRGGQTEKITRVRVSGKCQTWKLRPEAFRLPVKHGLYESFAITEANAPDFHLESECPLGRSPSRDGTTDQQTQ